MQAFGRFDDLQDDHRLVRVEEPGGSYTMPLAHDLIVSVLQDTETFSSSAVTPLMPDPMYSVIPIMLDPPEHTKWRRVLASYFSVHRIPALEPSIREVCGGLIDGFAGRGGCELVGEFVVRFPTTVFLGLMGLPAEELDTFLEWVRAILRPDVDGELQRERQIHGTFSVLGRLQEAIADRRRWSGRGAGADAGAGAESGGEDIISQALGWEIDGRPVTDDEVLSCCFMLFMAGLDTVANALAYSFFHLAAHPEDQAWLREDADGSHSRYGQATEEFLRVFSIGQLARKVRVDTELDGCPVAAGSMLYLPLAAAGRDPTAFDRAREVDIRREPAAHYAFGAGPHRCLGSHLARREIAVALEMWHERIPAYEIDPAAAPVLGHWGHVHALEALPLVW